MDSLYREAALSHRSRVWNGRALLARGLPAWVHIALTAFFFTLLALYSALELQPFCGAGQLEGRPGRDPRSGPWTAKRQQADSVGELYRRAVACILQEDRLFAGSLRENMTGFIDSPDEAWLHACARVGHIHDDIMALPMGYDTLTGELGEGLSGGQRQRIFIVRALYRRPAILFMDEATSHLDEHNEALINAAIRGLSITRVIIAHRSSTIASADRTIHLGNMAA